MRAPLILLPSLLLLSHAYGFTLGGFDDARPLAPLWIEAGGGMTLGQAASGGQLSVGLGLVEHLEINARGGLSAVDGRLGGAFEIGGLYQLLSLRQTGVVEVAALGLASAARTERVTRFGLDPLIIASRHFALDPARQLYVSASLGPCLSVDDVDGAEDTASALGLSLSLGVGVDIIPALTLHLQGRLRDEDARLGLGLSYTL
ncbi:hypothetical protein KKF91_06670 [Myxococcota bacterium]|nr:hypothetical protein [Myxococcota bacterium]